MTDLPLPGVRTMCLLDHRCGPDCPPRPVSPPIPRGESETVGPMSRRERKAARAARQAVPVSRYGGPCSCCPCPLDEHSQILAGAPCLNCPPTVCPGYVEDVPSWLSMDTIG